MNLRRWLLKTLLCLWPTWTLAQYGTPDSLRAEAKPGNDLVFPSSPQTWSATADIANQLFAPTVPVGEKRPALIVFHTCAGPRSHLRYWVEQALGEGYVVLVPNGMRGIQTDCGSPPQISNARLIKDGLDAVAHLATLPFVDARRISLVGFSKGAFVGTWMASSQVAEALRPGTPPLAAAVAVYGFCGLPPTRGRPQGAVILQPDTDRPLLMLMGAQDKETPPDSCLERLPPLKARGAPVEWHLYPEATHAWDSQETHNTTRTIYNGERVTYRYDASATADTRRRLFDFLARMAPAR